ncbi:YciI family protein [Rarobacter faecitabidus]|nr:YciI family protein [Rarobacter faecitabidus]
MLTDGPFVESKEYINGLWIIDVPNRDDALGVAVEASRVCRGSVQVRPFN